MLLYLLIWALFASDKTDLATPWTPWFIGLIAVALIASIVSNNYRQGFNRAVEIINEQQREIRRIR